MSNDSKQPDGTAVDGFDVSRRLVEGRQRFLGIDLLCGPGALVPRLETELLGAAAIELGKSLNEPRVIDMCCGAGNLACAIAMHAPAARVWASDLTDGCIGWTEIGRAHV